mmetsp:Transcript_3745/g.5003  ORF Transcript_3745/g.5003 Transcript_3745/m.5003 type:complete len:83 (-) Transcript_3745:1588-1836(-)
MSLLLSDSRVTVRALDNDLSRRLLTHSAIAPIGVNAAHDARDTTQELVNFDILGQDLEQVLAHIVFARRFNQTGTRVHTFAR